MFQISTKHLKGNILDSERPIPTFNLKLCNAQCQVVSINVTFADKVEEGLNIHMQILPGISVYENLLRLTAQSVPCSPKFQAQEQ